MRYPLSGESGLPCGETPVKFSPPPGAGGQFAKYSEEPDSEETRKQGKFGESNIAPQLNFILSLLCEGRRATTQGGAWTGSGWRVSLGSEKEVWRQPDMRPCYISSNYT